MKIAGFNAPAHVRAKLQASLYYARKERRKREADTPVFENDVLRDLFANGESGLLLSYHPGHLYADVDKTVAAAFGGGVASFDDLSGNSVTGPQPTSTARPILGRVPRTGRRNLLTYTEQLDNAAWTGKIGITVSANAILAPDGTLTADKLVETAEGGDHRIGRAAGNTETGYYISVYAKAGERHLLMIERGYGGTNGDTATFDLSNGTVVRANPVVEPVSIEHVGDGWYRCSCYMPQANNSRRCGFVIGNPDNPTGGSPSSQAYEGDGVSGLYLWGAQISYDEVGPYQRVTNAYDVTEAGVPSDYYAHYDLADDVLPKDATLPAITGGTAILIGRNGIWIDEGYSFAGGNWSLGPTTYPNGPTGIVGVVGDKLDLVVLNRPLTADERAKVVAYGVKRGSAGLFELGPELVVNGDFSDGATGWSLHASASVVDGRIVFDGVTPISIGTVLAEASGSPLPDAGLHIVEFSITEDTLADISLRFGGDAGQPRKSYGVYRRIVNGVSERASVRPRTTDGVRAGSVDNVSARRLIMPGETP